MRIHLVDGTFELYRAHFSKRPSKHLDNGQDVKASVGVVQSLLQLLDDPAEQVTHLAVAFDNPV
jgi:5'-3' exonuclease